MKACVAALVASFAAGVAAAEGGREAAPREVAPAPYAAAAFEHLDANRDGAISAMEAAFEQPVWRGFEKADADRDRKLSREEFERWLRTAHPVPVPGLLLPPR